MKMYLITKDELENLADMLQDHECGRMCDDILDDASRVYNHRPPILKKMREFILDLTTESFRMETEDEREKLIYEAKDLLKKYDSRNKKRRGL